MLHCRARLPSSAHCPIPSCCSLRHAACHPAAAAPPRVLQSEYAPKCDARREFITGFDGSAGTAVITQAQALLWTDGRYFLQARARAGLAGAGAWVAEVGCPGTTVITLALLRTDGRCFLQAWPLLPAGMAAASCRHGRCFLQACVPDGNMDESCCPPKQSQGSATSQQC